jgi:hypothetical protein
MLVVITENKINQYQTRFCSGYNSSVMPQAPNLSGFFIGGKMVKKKKRPDGTGNIRPDGYLEVQENYKRIFVHVKITEEATGIKIIKPILVHHANKNRSDNHKGNLVICPDAAYHRLLHNRLNAVINGFPAHFRKCPYCFNYDDPGNMDKAGKSYRHKKCIKLYDHKRYEGGKNGNPKSL